MQVFSEKQWNYWYDCVYAYFYRRVNNKTDVQDLTIECLEVYFLHAGKIDSLEGFIWGIAKRKMLEYIRKKQKNTIQDLDENQSQIDIDTITQKHFTEKISNLKKCIQNQLSVQDQEIVELSIMQDFSSKDVSEKLNLTASNVRQKLSRSIKKLKDKCKQLWLE